MVETLRSARHYALTGLLGPLFVLQGRSARRKVPVLPEAAGDRRGRRGDGPPLRLLIVGDSAAAGVGAPHQDQALLGRTVARLAERFEVDWTLLARSGNTTNDVLESLASLRGERFDVAVSSLGVNDTIARWTRVRWSRRQAELRRRLKGDFGASLVVTCGLPPVHGFPALPQPLRWYLGERARQLDRVIARESGRDPGFRYLSLAFATDPELMAEDGFHPGPDVYGPWGENLAELILTELG